MTGLRLVRDRPVPKLEFLGATALLYSALLLSGIAIIIMLGAALNLGSVLLPCHDCTEAEGTAAAGSCVWSLEALCLLGEFIP